MPLPLVAMPGAACSDALAPLVAMPGATSSVLAPVRNCWSNVRRLGPTIPGKWCETASSSEFFWFERDTQREQREHCGFAVVGRCFARKLLYD